MRQFEIVEKYVDMGGNVFLPQKLSLESGGSSYSPIQYEYVCDDGSVHVIFMGDIEKIIRANATWLKEVEPKYKVARVFYTFTSDEGGEYDHLAQHRPEWNNFKAEDYPETYINWLVNDGYLEKVSEES